MKSNFYFMVKTAKIIEEVLVRTCIDKADTEVLADILKDELNECYDDGYAACKSSLEEDVDSAYDEGYSLGHDEGYENGHSEGYDKGHSDGYYEGYENGYEEGYSESHS